MIKYYQVKSGNYAGMWHVRDYVKGKYFHIGRFKHFKQVKEVLRRAQ